MVAHLRTRLAQADESGIGHRAHAPRQAFGSKPELVPDFLGEPRFSDFQVKNILSEIYCESVRSKLCIAWVSAVVGLQMQFLFEIVLRCQQHFHLIGIIRDCLGIPVF